MNHMSFPISGESGMYPIVFRGAWLGDVWNHWMVSIKRNAVHNVWNQWTYLILSKYPQTVRYRNIGDWHVMMYNNLTLTLILNFTTKMMMILTAFKYSNTIRSSLIKEDEINEPVSPAIEGWSKGASLWTTRTPGRHYREGNDSVVKMTKSIYEDQIRARVPQEGGHSIELIINISLQLEP